MCRGCNRTIRYRPACGCQLRLWVALDLLHGLDDKLWQHGLEDASQLARVQLQMQPARNLVAVYEVPGCGRPD